MAQNVNIFSYSFAGAVDLSASQYCAVTLSTTAPDTIALPAAGAQVIGIISNPNRAGIVGGVNTVQVLGIAKVLVGVAGVTAGDKLTPDTSGRAVTAVTGNHVFGIALETAASGALVTVLLQQTGKA